METKKKRGRPAKVKEEVPEPKRNAMGRIIEEPTPEPVTTYTIDITIGDTHLHGEGTSALEALESIQKPQKITTKVFVSLSDGTTTKDVMFMPTQAKRMFYPQAQYVFARNFTFLLK